MMRRLLPLALALVSSHAHAQVENPRPVLVLGPVQHHLLDGNWTLGPLLRRAKARPQANILGAKILSRNGERDAFPQVREGASRVTPAVLSRTRIAPFEILLIPPIPTAGRSAEDLSLQAVLRHLRVSKLPSEIEQVLRIYVLRHHDSPKVLLAQAKALDELDCETLIPYLFLVTKRTNKIARREARRLIVANICIDDCFPGTTRVWTPEGARPIASLRRGDRVLDAEGRQRRVRRVLRSRASRLIELRFGSTIVRASLQHRIFTQNRGAVAAHALRAGDVLQTGRGAQRLDSSRLKVLRQPITLYNLRLATGSSFRVGADFLAVESATSRAARPAADSR